MPVPSEILGQRGKKNAVSCVSRCYSILIGLKHAFEAGKSAGCEIE
jgi:hypothetical protein